MWRPLRDESSTLRDTDMPLVLAGYRHCCPKAKGFAARTSANPSSFMVAGARNYLQANRSLGFCFEIAI
jgi:hypothetical protein